MPASTKKDRYWREFVEAALKKAGRWAEFNAECQALRKSLMEAAGSKDWHAYTRKAWHQTIENYPGIVDEVKFEDNWARRVEQEKNKKLRNLAAAGRAGKLTIPAFEHPALSDLPEEDETIFIEGAQEGDILRDTKWVYFNLSRLIKTNRNGTRTLDKSVLKEAPSNGAVGLAQYALEEQKAFIEKFVTKILPKDETPEKVPTPEELRAELDPTLGDLERYMKRVG